MKFNRQTFFQGFRREFSNVISQSQVNGIEFLLSAFERDAIWSDIRHISYALATIAIETAYTYQPIQEFGSRAYFERRYGYRTKKGRELGNDAPGEGAKYSGKGYVQLTGESNFEKMEEIIRRQNPQIVTEFERRTGQRFDLTDFANQAKDPQIAFLILTIGMFRGTFTGKAFGDYINNQKTDYRNARRIVNGLDKADMIAGFAMKFEKILKSSLIAAPAAATTGSSQAVFTGANPLSNLTDANIESAVNSALPSAREIPAGIQTVEAGAINGDNPASHTGTEGGQVAENITNVSADADASKVEAAQQLPPAELSTTEPSNFLGKMWKTIIGVFTGAVAVPTFLQNGLDTNTALQKILEIILNNFIYIFFGSLIGLVVWFVVKKINNFQLTQLKANINSDPARRDIQFVEPDNLPQPRGLFGRIRYVTTGK